MFLEEAEKSSTYPSGLLLCCDRLAGLGATRARACHQAQGPCRRAGRGRTGHPARVVSAAGTQAAGCCSAGGPFVPRSRARASVTQRLGPGARACSGLVWLGFLTAWPQSRRTCHIAAQGPRSQWSGGNELALEVTWRRFVLGSPVTVPLEFKDGAETSTHVPFPWQTCHKRGSCSLVTALLLRRGVSFSGRYKLRLTRFRVWTAHA